MVILDRIDPFSAEFQQDPFPYYDAMRETSPAWHCRGPTPLHHPLRRRDRGAARHRDVLVRVRRDRQPAARTPPRGTARSHPQPGLGPPADDADRGPSDHTRYRNTVSQAFNARAIAALRPAILAIVEEEISRFIDDGTVSFKRVFATPVPVRVIVTALNLPAGCEADIKRWSDDTTASIGANLSDERLIEAQWGILELQRFMFAELEERRRCPRHDVPSALVAAELPLPDGEGSRPLTTEELMGIFQQLIGAGNETTTKLFSQMMRMLAEQHDEWWKLKAEPERAAKVVEEALRLASPTQGLYRKVTRDVDIEGTTVPAGDRVLVMFTAANRDPAVFPDPPRFDPDRPNVRSHVRVRRRCPLLHRCTAVPAGERRGVGAACPPLGGLPSGRQQHLRLRAELPASWPEGPGRGVHPCVLRQKLRASAPPRVRRLGRRRRQER